MTLATVRRELRALGITIRSRDGEYRINFLNGSEATAYYTTLLPDALGTGRLMAREVERKGKQDRAN